MSHPSSLPATLIGRTDVPPVLACSWTDCDVNAACVHLAGELDIATTPQLERILREPQSQARLVVLDLRELAFIDSSGVHAIVNAGIRARQLGGRIVVLRGPPNVDRMFTITAGLDGLEIGDGNSFEPPVGAHAPGRGVPLEFGAA